MEAIFVKNVTLFLNACRYNQEGRTLYSHSWENLTSNHYLTSHHIIKMKVTGFVLTCQAPTRIGRRGAINFTKRPLYKRRKRSRHSLGVSQSRSEYDMEKRDPDPCNGSHCIYPVILLTELYLLYIIRRLFELQITKMITTRKLPFPTFNTECTEKYIFELLSIFQNETTA
jgi:hypothetical protein